MTMGGDLNNINTNDNNKSSQFGDTTLTKVFVGGLAWEAPKEALFDHFQKYGQILEAVIISDKITGRSKGYGFVTFKDAEAAKKACEDATPTINGRRANCNLAALGARHPPRSSSTTTPQRPPSNGRNNAVSPTTGGPGHGHGHGHGGVQWYYSGPVPGRAASPTTTTPFHAHPHHQPLPFYGYSPSYIAADVAYNHKLSYGGAYVNTGHYAAQMYPGQAGMMGGTNTLMSVYPYYHPYLPHQVQQSHHQAAMGLPAHIFPTTSGPITAPPPIISKPTIPVCIAPPSVCLTVE
ncbi:unnamed protein product [Amaranthus hypochondriacus]